MGWRYISCYSWSIPSMNVSSHLQSTVALDLRKKPLPRKQCALDRRFYTTQGLSRHCRVETYSSYAILCLRVFWTIRCFITYVLAFSVCNKCDGTVWPGLYGAEQGQVETPCALSNKPAGCMKREGISCLAEEQVALKEGLSFCWLSTRKYRIFRPIRRIFPPEKRPPKITLLLDILW